MLQNRERVAATTLAVLAGGKGNRMGSAKGTLSVGGENILPHLMRRLAWSGPTMLVTAPGRTSPPGSEMFDRECVDPIEGQGPLRGILTALSHAEGDVVTITVDMPGMTATMLEVLIDFLTTRAADLGVMFCRVSHAGGIIEPFPCLLKAGSRGVISAMIDQGRRSVRGLLSDSRFNAIDAPSHWPASVWTNLNTPEDLAAYEKSIRSPDKM